MALGVYWDGILIGIFAILAINDGKPELTFEETIQFIPQIEDMLYNSYTRNFIMLWNCQDIYASSRR
jgi:hypothetical protein